MIARSGVLGNLAALGLSTWSRSMNLAGSAGILAGEFLSTDAIECDLFLAVSHDAVAQTKAVDQGCLR